MYRVFDSVGATTFLQMTIVVVVPSGNWRPSAHRGTTFAAQYLTYTCPCQRFTYFLAW